MLRLIVPALAALTLSCGSLGYLGDLETESTGCVDGGPREQFGDDSDLHESGDTHQSGDTFQPGDTFQLGDTFQPGDTCQPGDAFQTGDTYDPGDTAPVNVLTLVEPGIANSIIVIGNDAPASSDTAAAELQHHVALATGVELEIVTESQASSRPAHLVRLVLGGGPLAREAGLDTSGLEREQFRLVTTEDSLFFFGNEQGASPALTWAVGDFLDREVGVRWLWPGDLGTHVPQRQRLAIGNIDRRGGPALVKRRLRGNDAGARGVWRRRLQVDSRSNPKICHCFRDWWDRFHLAHPDYFAVPPSGYSQPWPQADRVKLNIGNPAVADRVMQEWRAAGRPDSYGVGPNDGSGFCTGAQSRALDLPAEYSASDIWNNRANLTRRYVTFWNGLIERMREENPNTVIGTFAYSAYRTPPPDDLPLSEGIMIFMVRGYATRDAWEGWYEAGASSIFLRPNWWHMGGSAPHIPLHVAGEYFRWALSHGMVGYDMDMLLGYWGTQGPYYYLIPRLAMRPDLTVDEVIDEWLSAFGAAAPAVREYLLYWEDFTNRAAYPFPAGGALSQDSTGLYEVTVRENNLPMHPLTGSWRVIPYLFTEELIAPARAHLTEARGLVAPGTDAHERVSMLEDALELLEMRREVIRLMYPATQRPEDTPADFEAAKAAWTSHKNTMVASYGPVMEGGPVPVRLQGQEDLSGM